MMAVLVSSNIGLAAERMQPETNSSEAVVKYQEQVHNDDGCFFTQSFSVIATKNYESADRAHRIIDTVNPRWEPRLTPGSVDPLLSGATTRKSWRSGGVRPSSVVLMIRPFTHTRTLERTQPELPVSYTT
jgi:hypothetical protein